MPTLQFTAPVANTTFTITADPVWPSMVFRTGGTGPHTWQWTVTWGSFTRSGSAATTGNEWDAMTAVTNLGGKLDVVANAGGVSGSISVLIRGTNPTEAQVTTFLSSNVNSAGFERIIRRESRFKHFNAAGEPVKSFDNGYGMCQLTTPPPSFEQAWNWQTNVAGGLQLFAHKYAAAVAYLSRGGRTYTPDQASLEAVSRWNGGRYHEWDATAGAWVRNPNILCDSAAGNIGWDMNDPANAGQTEAQLHARDAGSYHRGPQAGAHWGYFGVCYADHH